MGELEQTLCDKHDMTNVLDVTALKDQMTNLV